MTKTKQLLRSKRAQGMTEYILIVALIALVAIVGVRMFGSKIAAIFQHQAQQLGTDTGVPDTSGQ